MWWIVFLVLCAACESQKWTLGETHVAHQALEEDKLGLQLLHPERQLILAHLALLQVLWAGG